MFNGDYLSIPEGTDSCGYIFHEIPGTVAILLYYLSLILYESDRSTQISRVQLVKKIDREYFVYRRVILLSVQYLNKILGV